MGTDKEPYIANGYKNRNDYLECMAYDFDIPLATVLTLAGVLGPSEDFDGLVVALEDEAERRWQQGE